MVSKEVVSKLRFVPRLKEPYELIWLEDEDIEVTMETLFVLGIGSYKDKIWYDVPMYACHFC